MDPYQPPDDPDLDNPYAPPRSAFVPEAAPELIGGMPFGVNDVFNWSWSIFKEKMGLCLAIFWGAAGINLAISFSLGILLQVITAISRDMTMFMIANILVNFSSFVIQMWLTTGQTMAFLKIARGEPVAFDEIFKGGRFVLTVILGGIVFVVILAVPIGIAVGVSVLGFVLMGNQSIGAVILFLVVSSLAGVFVIYVSSRLVMYYYLVIDRNAGVIDSLQQSWQLCRQRVGTIILVFFLQMAIGLAGFLALCVGLIFALPLSGLTMPITYLALTGTSTPKPQRSEFSWEEDL